MNDSIDEEEQLTAIIGSIERDRRPLMEAASRELGLRDIVDIRVFGDRVIFWQRERHGEQSICHNICVEDLPTELADTCILVEKLTQEIAALDHRRSTIALNRVFPQGPGGGHAIRAAAMTPEQFEAWQND